MTVELPTLTPVRDAQGVDQNRIRLGDLLLQAGKLTPRDLERALQAQGEMGSLLGKVLVQLGLVSEQDVVATLAQPALRAISRSNDESPTINARLAGTWQCARISSSIRGCGLPRVSSAARVMSKKCSQPLATSTRSNPRRAFPVATARR